MDKTIYHMSAVRGEGDEFIQEALRNNDLAELGAALALAETYGHWKFVSILRERINILSTQTCWI